MIELLLSTEVAAAVNQEQVQFAQDAVCGDLPLKRVGVFQTLQHALGLGVTEHC